MRNITKEQRFEIKSQARRIAVEQLLDDEKTVVAEFKSMREAAKKMNRDLSTICIAIKHNFNCGGFRWRKKTK